MARPNTKKCKLSGCKEPHHARGYCNVHYKKYMKHSDPLAGAVSPMRGQKRNTQAAEPEKKKPRTQGENFSFFLNQKFIEKIYQEAVKSLHEPLYMSNNRSSLVYLLETAAYMSGYDGRDSSFLSDLVGELREWAEVKDRIRFMYALANWETKAETFSSKKKPPKQLSLFTAKA